MNSTHTQRQLSRAAPIWLFGQCHISYRLLAFVSRHVYLIISVRSHMSVAEWADTDGIQHWPILWSSYRKLAWVECEPETTEPPSDPLTDWAIRPCVKLALRASFVQALQYHHFVQCHVSLQLFAFVSCHVYLIEFFCTYSHECCWISWCIWYLPLTDSLK